MIRVRTTVEMRIASLLARQRRGSVESLAQAGALVRGVAQRSIAIMNRKAKKRRKRRGAPAGPRGSRNASRPGTPPHSRRGRLKRAILFEVEDRDRNVVIGPTANVVGTSASAHEFGGRYRGGRYPERPFMGPALERVRNRLSKFWENSLR